MVFWGDGGFIADGQERETGPAVTTVIIAITVSFFAYGKWFVNISKALFVRLYFLFLLLVLFFISFWGLSQSHGDFTYMKLVYQSSV